MPVTPRPTNRLLAAIPKKEYKDLLPRLERVPLNFNENIYEPGDIIRNVYFPESGIVSLLSRVDPQSSIEVGIVGDEGMAGMPVFLGVKTSVNVAVVQGAGFAESMSVSDFRYSCRDGTDLPRVLRLFLHSLMSQISQSAACNRFHPIDSRLARWLLMTADRMHANEFQITQEFLSNMLGVRREAVNKAAGDLQRDNFIHYNRGILTILDRKGLEGAACPCYQIIKREYRTMAA